MMKIVRSYLNSLKKLTETGFFHIFGSNTINQIVNFAYGILIVRVISKEEYGIFGYASNIYSMLMLLSGFGIVSATLQIASESARDTSKTASLIQYGYRFGLRFNTGLSLLILLTAWLIPLPIKGSNNILGMMFLLPVPLIVKDLQIVWLRANLRNKEYGTVNTLNAILVSVLTILGAWLLQSVGIVIGQYIAVVLMLILLWKSYRVPFITKDDSLTQKDKKDLFAIAGISTLNNALSQMLSLLGTFMLGLVVSDPNTIATYKVASAIPMALNFIPNALMIYLYPYFARNKNNRKWVISKYRQVMLYAGIGNLLIALAGIVLAEPIISIIFGAEYLDARSPFRIMMASYFISGTFCGIPRNLLVTQRRLGINLITGIILAVLSIVFNMLLIPRLGSIGAAVSYLLTMVISGVMSTIAFGIIIRRIHIDE